MFSAWQSGFAFDDIAGIKLGKCFPMRRVGFVVDQLSKFAFVELHISQ